MKKLVIGVDIGGINTAFGLVDENGDLYAESVISTKKYPYFDDYKAYVADLCDAMHAMADSLSFDYELAGIGIGAPNANYHKGTIETPANLWKFREDEPNPDESRRIFPLVEDIARCFGGVKTLMTNDANAATIGEMVYGNAKGMRDFIMGDAGHGSGFGFRGQRRDDLRQRRLCGRVRPHHRRAQRPPVRLRTSGLSGDLRLGHGHQAHGLRADGDDDRTEQAARHRLCRFRRLDDFGRRRAG